MAQNVARLGVVLGLDTAEFQKGLDSAKKSLNEFANKIPTMAAGAVAAIGAMAYKSMQMADTMSDLADATDMSIASILHISEALEQSGGKSENAGRMLSAFTRKVDEAAQGSLTAQKAFARVGVTLEDLRKLSTEELFLKTNKNLAGMTENAGRTGAAFDLMSKAANGVDLKKFNEDLQHGNEEFKKYEDAVRIAGDLNDKLAKKSHEMALNFTLEVMPALNAFFDLINTKGGIAEKVFFGIKAVILGLTYAIGSVPNAIDLMGVSWDKFRGKISAKEMVEEIAKIEKRQTEFKKKLQDIDNGVSQTKPKADPFTGRSVTAGKDAEADKQKEMLRVAGLISEEYQRQAAFSLQQLAIRGQMEGMTSDERRVQEAINQQLDATSKKLDEITKKREDAAGRGADAKTLTEYDKQFEEVQKFGKDYAKAAEVISRSTIATQRTFSYGWEKAFKQYAEDAENYGKLAEDMFHSFTSNMNSAIDTFVETGKFSFSSFAESVIKDLIKIEMRMQASQLLSMGLKFAMGAIGGAMAGGADVSSISTAQWQSGAFAEGGQPEVGVPSLVGERGPELFVPHRAGTVIPNNKLNDMLGGGGVTYNGPYIASMNAIDTQSGIQFLAKNKMTIWSMNQSANRSIPTGR